MKWRAKFFQAMPQITQDYPTARWLFLTLTVRNVAIADLRQTVTHMNQSFVRLTKLKIFPAIGWLKSVEVTRNPKDGTAHPHFHCLLMVASNYFGRNYVNQKQWRDAWQQSLRVEYEPSVNIKVVKEQNGSSQNGSSQNGSSISDDNSIAKAICETLKYSVKPDDLAVSSEWLEELTRQLHKTRAVSVGGILRKYLKEDSDDDDLVHIEEENGTDSEMEESILFGWRESIKRYALNGTSQNGMELLYPE